MARSQARDRGANRGRQGARARAAKGGCSRPGGVTSYAQFVPVYERWFGFFSRGGARRPLRRVHAALPSGDEPHADGGPVGACGRASGTPKSGVEPGLLSSGASDDFGREPSAIPLTRTIDDIGKATRNGNTDVTYRFQEDARGHEGGDEASSRNRAVDEEAGAAQGSDGPGLCGQAGTCTRYRRGARAGSLRGHRRESLSRGCRSTPMRTTAMGRDGAKTGWNYLLIANIGHATGHLEQVYEHKVNARRHVARYLVAMSQHLQTLTQRHEIKAGKACERAAARRHGRSFGRRDGQVPRNASAIYGDPEDRKASEDSTTTRRGVRCGEENERSTVGDRQRAIGPRRPRDVRTKHRAFDG